MRYDKQPQQSVNNRVDSSAQGEASQSPARPRNAFGSGPLTHPLPKKPRHPRLKARSSIALLGTGALAAATFLAFPASASAAGGQVYFTNSPDGATFTVGSGASFTVTAASSLQMPIVSEDPQQGTCQLPPGMTYTYEGGPSALISGTPSASDAGTYNCTFQASNAYGVTYQQYQFNVVNVVPKGTFYATTRNSNGSWQSWNTVNNGSSPFAGSQEAIAALPDGTTQYLGVGLDGNLYHNIQYANGTWQGWAAIAGVNGAPTFNGATSVAITGMPNDTSQEVALGPDGVIYHNIRYSSSWQGWAALPGQNTISSPEEPINQVAIAGMPDGSSQVYARVGINIYETTRNSAGTSWSPWQAVIALDRTAASDIAVAGMPDGTTQILAVAEGNLYHDVYTASTNSGTTPQQLNLGNVSNVAITAMPDDTSQLLAVGANGTLYHEIRYTNGNFSGFQTPAALPGQTANQVGIAGLPNGNSQILATAAN